MIKTPKIHSNFVQKYKKLSKIWNSEQFIDPYRTNRGGYRGQIFKLLHLRNILTHILY